VAQGIDPEFKPQFCTKKKKKKEWGKEKKLKTKENQTDWHSWKLAGLLLLYSNTYKICYPRYDY
jgi:hypothetical protein